MATSIVTAPRVHPVCEIAVGDVDVEVGQARYDTSRYDQGPDATYAGLDPEWFDVSCDVFEATTYTGRERTVDVFDVGTANLTVSNESGWADYPSSGVTVLSVRPGRQIRLGVDVDGIDDGPFWLWRGWIDRTEPGYDPVAGDVVYIDCVDAKGEYGRADLVRYDTAVGAGESVVARLNRVANLVHVPAHRRQFDEAGAALRATQMGGRAAAQYDTAARSAGGAVFGDNNGFLTYRGQDWLSFPADRPADARIGNTGADDVCPNGWEVSFDRADFSTHVLYGRSGEEARIVEDVPNRDLFGVETFNLTGLDTDDTVLLDLVGARALAARNFELAPRIAAVAVDAARSGVAEVLIGADPFAPSLYTCVHVDDGVERFARTMYLTGVEHTITPTHWTARLALDDATPYLAGSDARYDTAHYNTDRYGKAA